MPRRLFARRRSIAALVAAFSVTVCAFALSACDDDGGEGLRRCQLDPAFCGVDYPGGFCDSHSECGTGYCCLEQANCGGGMCTYQCASSADCPPDMACQHNTCFYRCNFDEDCARGQRCEHDRTVCEYP
jgi:hypothetical protein